MLKNKKKDFEESLIEEEFFLSETMIDIWKMKLGMKFLSLANEGWKSNFEFHNPRSSIRGTFIPLQCRAISFFFFLIDCTENATLEDPLEGVDFAPPLFFLSFFFLPHPTEAQKKEYSRRNSQSISFHAYLTSFYVWCRDMSKLHGMMYESSFDSNPKKINPLYSSIL